ncbi:SDR family NAD(P)-dependent oxidoreductase [Frondihabitans australicus]|uniref:NAD(P)-dependent dehydrogenase (Short-subunit alcohol dehydrogenase family) n=1 Tax=Frondihabitans australicus TaxID=386892 RepID=A0A495IFJ8_9MICO|nr:SDR family oxidoreductase [Frondihabitans australicus]RKR74792.1 NAD(P)-dependent dehydrogenase (short-subunit alcohol dehydrogenase family) [Frondihabitans australicus]
MTRELAGTRAFITGGGTGIGRESALALAALGSHVTVAGRTMATLDETVDTITAAGGSAEAVQCDVSDEASARAAVEAAAGRDGRLDFAVNSAGVSGGDDLRPLGEYDTAQFDRMVAIDLRGTFLAMKYEIRAMEKNGHGSIVNIASGAGLVGVPGFAGYAAAKHGQVGLTKAAALDYGTKGIRVNAIAAGLVDTPLVATGRSPEVMAARIAAHPIGRIGRPEEIADAVVWLCSNRSSFVTGTAIPVDGGYVAR